MYSNIIFIQIIEGLVPYISVFIYIFVFFHLYIEEMIMDSYFFHMCIVL